MRSLLIVDDEYNIRDGLMNAVPWETVGVRVAGCARDGIEALQKMPELNPDIILTDVRMDKMDGLAMAWEVLKQYPHVKIIFLSGYDEPEYIRKSLNLKAFSYLLKPVRGKELIEVMKKLVAEIQEEEELRKKIAELESFGGEWGDEFIYPSEKEETLLQSAICTALDADKEIAEQVNALFRAMEAQGCRKDRMYIEIIGLLGILSRKTMALGIDVYAFFGKDLPDPFQAYKLFRTNWDFADWFLRILLAVNRETQKTRPNHTRNIIAEANAFMEGHYCEYDFSLNAAAAHLSLNPSYFSRIYKHETKTNFTEALTQLRLRKAKSLLLETDRKIPEVADMVGYPNDKYFSALFKKYYKYSPSECRERRKRHEVV